MPNRIPIHSERRVIGTELNNVNSNFNITLAIVRLFFTLPIYFSIRFFIRTIISGTYIAKYLIKNSDPNLFCLFDQLNECNTGTIIYYYLFY